MDSYKKLFDTTFNGIASGLVGSLLILGFLLLAYIIMIYITKTIAINDQTIGLMNVSSSLILL